MHKKAYLFLTSYIVLITLLASCVSKNNWAPVESLKWSSQDSYPTIHTVERGDTLYTLAFKYEQDHEKLARLNGLHSPYHLYTGQRLKIKATSSLRSRFNSSVNSNEIKRKAILVPVNKTQRTLYLGSSKKEIRNKKPQEGMKPTLAKSKIQGKWYWPTKGKVFSEFSPEQGKKGIDIAGKKGDKIHAARDGIIAYAGSGLGGYGNLIIIKHDNLFLTAYGNNLTNLVSEGERVRAGQVIANMGIIDRKFWGVHFEIRKMGKPINPLFYLNARSP